MKTDAKKRHPVATACITCILLLMLNACASREEILGFQADHRQIRAGLEAQQRELARRDSLMQEELLNLAARAHESELILRSLKADQLQTAEELHSLVGTITASLQDAGVYNQRLARKVDELNLILARQGVRQERDSLASDPAWLYNQATLDLYRGFPELARAGFREYLARFPEGEEAAHCRYWIADTWISEQQPDSASQALQQFLVEYPGHTRRPAALLRLALLEAAAGEDASAASKLESVIQDYPESAEARLARERLLEWERQSAVPEGVDVDSGSTNKEMQE